MLISVIVTTYNRPDALLAVLRGLQAQTDCAFEVLVADDGSTDETKEAIASILSASPVPIRHLWQSDNGFRAAAARNNGILAAEGNYLIFLDGDCIPQRDFIARHRQLAEPGRTVTGSRILFSEIFTNQVLEKQLNICKLTAREWLGHWKKGHVNKLLPFLAKLPDGRWRHRQKFAWRRIKSCNLATWKADAFAINGFDETFSGWGHEDADFVLRLMNRGIRRKDGVLATEVFHLWHREAARQQESENRRRVEIRLTDGTTRASIGLADHMSASADSAERSH